MYRGRKIKQTFIVFFFLFIFIFFFSHPKQTNKQLEMNHLVFSAREIYEEGASAEGKIALDFYLHHLLQNTCSGNKETYERVLDWMAVMVQDVQHQHRECLLIEGPSGCGKMTSIYYFCRLFRMPYLQTRCAMGEIEENAQKSIVVAEGRLPNNPSQLTQLLGGVNTHMNLILKTNCPYSPLYELNNRFLLIHARMPYEKNRKNYFERLHAMMMGGLQNNKPGFKALCLMLLQREVSKKE